MAGVNHTTRKHAILSASGASRWMNCTPSARLEEKMPEKTSTFAEEGTLAHELSDIILRKKLGEISTTVYNKEIKKIKANKLYYPEMDEEVAVYVDFCMDRFAEAKKRTPDAIAMIEKRLDFTHLVEQGFGTGDFGIIADGEMEIIDLKFGKGVEVSAEENPQLMLYGSGALRENELMFDIHTVTLTIVQPRLYSISSWEISADALREWGEQIVKPLAIKAYKGDGDQKVGEWCKFCKVKATCRAMQEFTLETAKHDFKDPHELSLEELIEIYKQSKMIKDWLESVSDHIQLEALKGTKIDGFKLVEGRTQRKLTNEASIIKVLEDNLFDKSDYITEKLKGLTDLEKLIGKKEFTVLLGDFIDKPKGAPTLAPESDKRGVWSEGSAAEDFSD